MFLLCIVQLFQNVFFFNWYCITYFYKIYKQKVKIEKAVEKKVEMRGEEMLEKTFGVCNLIAMMVYFFFFFFSVFACSLFDVGFRNLFINVFISGLLVLVFCNFFNIIDLLFLRYFQYSFWFFLPRYSDQLYFNFATLITLVLFLMVVFLSISLKSHLELLFPLIFE